MVDYFRKNGFFFYKIRVIAPTAYVVGDCGQSGQLSANRNTGGSVELRERPKCRCKVLSQLWEHVCQKSAFHISRLRGEEW